MAKVTLPNGIVIEADQVHVEEDGTVTLQDIKTETYRNSTPVAESVKPITANEAIKSIVNSLSRKQWETYMALKEMGGTVSVTALAGALDIDNHVAGGRARWLVKQGVAECVERGKYRALG